MLAPLLLPLIVACGVPPAPVVPGAGDYDVCEGLADLTDGAESGDEGRELQFPDASCSEYGWALTTGVDDEEAPPDRVTVGTWDLATGVFGADAWEMTGRGSRWELDLAAGDTVGCDAHEAVFVYFPWWGDVLGQVEILPRGDAYTGSGMYSGGDVTFHVDTTVGAGDAGTMRVCQPFSDARAHTYNMALETEGDEDSWSAEWERSGEAEGTVFLIAGLVTSEGEPVAAAGASAD